MQIIIFPLMKIRVKNNFASQSKFGNFFSHLRQISYLQHLFEPHKTDQSQYDQF